MIHVWTGLPGSGKTTKLASVALKILKRNLRYFKKTGTRRLVYSNIRFNEKVEQKYSDFIFYFTEITQLVEAREVDVIWQEMSIYCDSQEWEKATTDFKWWLRLHRHYGVDIYGDTQDFSTIDISVRRITNHVYRCFKIIGSRDKSATRPTIKFIWGLTLILSVDPASFGTEKEEYKYSGGFSLLFFDRFLCSIFNSYEHLAYDKYPPYKHIQRKCPDCGHSHTVHK